MYIYLYVQIQLLVWRPQFLEYSPNFLWATVKSDRASRPVSASAWVQLGNVPQRIPNNGSIIPGTNKNIN